MLEKLQQLEHNLKTLETFCQDATLDDVKSNKRIEWALRYGLFETIQIVIDISCHIVANNNLGIPKSYVDCVELLRQKKYIPEDLAKRLLGMVGLRNILVHEYTTVDIEKLYNLLDHLGDVRSFAESIGKYIR